MIELPYTHYWKTDYAHFDNNETMTDYLCNEMDSSWGIDWVYETQAMVVDAIGRKILVNVCGNGDSFNHMATLELLEES